MAGLTDSSSAVRNEANLAPHGAVCVVDWFAGIRVPIVSLAGEQADYVGRTAGEGVRADAA